MINSIEEPAIHIDAVDTVDCPRYLTKRAEECLHKYDDESSMTAGLDRRIVIKVQFNHGLVYDLERVSTKFEVPPRVFVHREQFAICLAYAITIHKSQGLSLDNALIDIGSSTFTCGQAYKQDEEYEVMYADPPDVPGEITISMVTRAVQAITSRLNSLAQFEGPESQVSVLVKAAKSVENLCMMDPSWHPWL
ncbi:hypothetical protein M8J77_007963 [Diaphorina citri]|nr:hypothetical protein M8J77_007963 [Diaphorina citri]